MLKKTNKTTWFHFHLWLTSNWRSKRSLAVAVWVGSASLCGVMDLSQLPLTIFLPILLMSEMFLSSDENNQPGNIQFISLVTTFSLLQTCSLVCWAGVSPRITRNWNHRDQPHPSMWTSMLRSWTFSPSTTKNSQLVCRCTSVWCGRRAGSLQTTR